MSRCWSGGIPSVCNFGNPGHLRWSTDDLSAGDIPIIYRHELAALLVAAGLFCTLGVLPPEALTPLAWATGWLWALAFADAAWTTDGV